jgi:hypothetical protein
MCNKLPDNGNNIIYNEMTIMSADIRVAAVLEEINESNGTMWY